MSFASIGPSRARAAVSLFAFALLVASPPSAVAAPPRPNGYPITNVNLRAGPGTDYPVIVTVPNRAWIAILGCLADYGWCDVFFEGNRGWMRSIYLAGWYQGYYYPLRDYAPQLGFPVVTFDVGTYWDAYYRNRPFYAERARWVAPRQEGWIDRGVFYDRLAPYGQWTWLEGQYVFVPGDTDRSWRPYSNGRWVYTDRYGWMWASNEPFGWATYHYGRWGFSKRIGWFWVPGSRWAPAWVSWRQSDDYLAWAPLPPSYDEGVSIDVSVGDVPSYYWQAVPSDQFLAQDLPRRIVRDPVRIRPVLERTQPLGNVVVSNTTVVNNVVNLQFVEQKTKEKVVVHKVEETNDAAQSGKVQGASVEVFQPKPDQKPAVAAPPKPKKIEEVAAESKTKDQAGGGPATDTMLLPPEIKTPEATQATPPAPPPPAKETKPAAEQAAPPPPPPPAKEAAPAGETAVPPSGKEGAPAAGEQGTPPPGAGETTTAPKANGEEIKGKEEEKEKTLSPPPAEGTPPPAGEAAPPPPAGEEATPKPHKKAAPTEEAAPPPPAGEEVPPPPGEEGAPKLQKKKVAPPAEEAAPPPAAEEPPPPPPAGEEVVPKAKKKVVPSGEETLPPPAEETAPHPKKKVAPPPEEGTPLPPPGEGATPPPPPSAGEVPPPPPAEGLARKNHKKVAPAGEGAPPPPADEGSGPPPPDGEQTLKHKKGRPPAEETAPPPAPPSEEGAPPPQANKDAPRPMLGEAGPLKKPHKQAPCPDGSPRLGNGECAPPQQ